MRVQALLFANLSRYLPPGARGGGAALELPDGTTVEDVMRRLAIPPDQPRLTLVNGQEAPPGRRLEPGDVVSVLPPLVGG